MAVQVPIQDILNEENGVVWTVNWNYRFWLIEPFHTNYACIQLVSQKFVFFGYYSTISMKLDRHNDYFKVQGVIVAGGVIEYVPFKIKLYQHSRNICSDNIESGGVFVQDHIPYDCNSSALLTLQSGVKHPYWPVPPHV